MIHTESEIKAWLASQLAAILNIPPQAIDVRAPFNRYGLVSRDAVGVSGDLEEWLGCRLPATLLYDYPTIEALARYLAAGTPITSTAESEQRPVHLREPIAIIGIGCRFPGANGPESFWKLLCEGVDAISEVPVDRWNKDDLYDPDPIAPGKMNTKWGGFLEGIDEFDANAFGISPHEAERMDPQQRILLEVVWSALEDAALQPERLVKSRTGVFVASSCNDYGRAQFAAPSLVDVYTSTGNALSILANRISYFYDLRGPSFTVDTACSSSLVAVHLACHSLQSGESSLAIVGAVNLVLHPEISIAFSKAGILAKDGRCKSFDARADGYVRSEGVGVVVLKPLSQAQADRNPIYALIRGSAVNQDGRANGLTAPNRQAQVAVLTEAYRDAGISPREVQYVEAHGSGTVLGDPIEAAALSEVIGQERAPGSICTIGSVKTNLGHLEAAAGIAGLIKVALSLHKEMLPSSLHFKQANPHIPFDQLPIRVQNAPAAWTRGEKKRIAGVSSFGFGGTNAHVVVEEAPLVTSSGSGINRPWQLLTLSAKTEAALEAVTSSLAGYLKRNPGVELADAGYTLCLGREAHRFRRVTVCRDSSDALRALLPVDHQRVLTSVCDSSDLKVVFMFPGLGDHYVHMTQDLYEHEATFKEDMDLCCKLISEQLGVDVRTLLYPARKPGDSAKAPRLIDDQSVRRMLGLGHNGSQASQSPLDRTALIQPALFAVEYSLARLLMKWGIRPQAVMGYSLGEYVAACIAGVLSLQDALFLVAKRAQLIEALPGGAMLAVPLSETEIKPYLAADLSVAVINTPNVCVISGSERGIKQCHSRLVEKGILCQTVRTQHAFHSAMMEPAVERFTEFVKLAKLNRPQIPCLSNVTGGWVTDEMTDPIYWSNHLRQTVKFAQGVQEILKTANTILLEVGPGQSLSSNVKQHPECSSDQARKVLRCQPSAQEQQSDLRFLLTTIGKLWSLGLAIDWQAFYPGGPPQKLRLWNYPFEHKRYWFSPGRPETLDGHRQPQAKDEPDKILSVADWFYVPIWKQSNLPALSQTIKDQQKGGTWLLFGDDSALSKRLHHELEMRGYDVVYAAAEPEFVKKSLHSYCLNPCQRSQYATLLEDLAREDRLPARIVHLWTAASDQTENGKSLQQILDRGFFSLLFLAQTLGDHGQPVEITVISSGVQKVLGNEGSCPESATLLGPCSVLPREYANISCRNIDVVMPEPGSAEEDYIIERLVAEMTEGRSNPIVAYRGTRRWIPAFDAVKLNPVSDRHGHIREKGVYLITGGLGGIGLAIAQNLARTAHARLALVGRTGLPPREHWQRHLENPETGPTQYRIRQVLALEESGAEVLLCTADVSDREEMRVVIQKVRDCFGEIHGIIHAAGVPGGSLAQFMTADTASRVLRPKLQGTLVLEEVTRDIPIDFLVLMSSVTAIAGGTAGQLDYCAANAFLDAYAQSHSTPRRRILSINWGEWQWNAWEEKLAGFGAKMAAFFRTNRQRLGMSFEEGVDALHRTLASGFSNVIVSPVLLEDLIRWNKSFSVSGIISKAETLGSDQPGYSRPVLGTPYVAPTSKLERLFARTWQDIMGINGIGVHDNFFELGGNSLMAMQIIAHIKKLSGLDLPLSLLSTNATIEELAAAAEIAIIQQLERDQEEELEQEGQKAG